MDKERKKKDAFASVAFSGFPANLTTTDFIVIIYYNTKKKNGFQAVFGR